MKRPLILGALLIGNGVFLLFSPALGRWLQVALWPRSVGPEFLRLPYWLCTCALVYLLFRLVLSFLVKRGSTNVLFFELHDHGIVGTGWRIFRRRTLHQARLGLLLTAWGVVIMGLVCHLYANGTLHQTELRMFPRGVVHYDSLPAIRTFAYTSGDRNPITYFRDLSAIVRHLKTAGAKVIVAEDPVYYKTRDSVILKTLRSLRESLREEGVLFHEGRKPSWFWSVWGSEASPNDTATFQPSSASVSVLLRQIGDLRSVPLSWFPALYRGASPHLDLALIAAARFQGIPDTTAVVLRSGTVKFGPLEISVDDEGRAVPLGEAASPQVFLPVGADRELMSDTLWYNVLRYRRYTIERMREFPVRDAESARGCIVLVSWWYLADEGTPSMEYAGVLSSLLNGRIARQYGHAPLWISAAGILVSLVLCAALRPRSAVPLVVLSAAGTFACGVWLLSAHSIMLSSAYPSLAMLLSAIVFPIVRLAHEHS